MHSLLPLRLASLPAMQGFVLGLMCLIAYRACSRGYGYACHAGIRVRTRVRVRVRAWNAPPIDAPDTNHTPDGGMQGTNGWANGSPAGSYSKLFPSWTTYATWNLSLTLTLMQWLPRASLTESTWFPGP